MAIPDDVKNQVGPRFEVCREYLDGLAVGAARDPRATRCLTIALEALRDGFFKNPQGFQLDPSLEADLEKYGLYEDLQEVVAILRNESDMLPLPEYHIKVNDLTGAPEEGRPYQDEEKAYIQKEICKATATKINTVIQELTKNPADLIHQAEKHQAEQSKQRATFTAKVDSTGARQELERAERVRGRQRIGMRRSAPPERDAFRDLPIVQFLSRLPTRDFRDEGVLSLEERDQLAAFIASDAFTRLSPEHLNRFFLEIVRSGYTEGVQMMMNSSRFSEIQESKLGVAVETVSNSIRGYEIIQIFRRSPRCARISVDALKEALRRAVQARNNEVIKELALFPGFSDIPINEIRTFLNELPATPGGIKTKETLKGSLPFMVKIRLFFSGEN